MAGSEAVRHRTFNCHEWNPANQNPEEHMHFEVHYQAAATNVELAHREPASTAWSGHTRRRG